MLIDHDSAAAAASAAKKPTATTESCHAVVVFNYACVGLQRSAARTVLSVLDYWWHKNLGH